MGDPSGARRLLHQDPKVKHRQIELLQIEGVLHQDHDPAAALDGLFDSFPLRQAPIFRALYFRSKLLLGDQSVLDELRSVLNLPGLDATELGLRVPY